MSGGIGGVPDGRNVSRASLGSGCTSLPTTGLPITGAAPSVLLPGASAPGWEGGVIENPSMAGSQRDLQPLLFRQLLGWPQLRGGVGGV